jgi:hypothetical protein
MHAVLAVLVKRSAVGCDMDTLYSKPVFFCFIVCCLFFFFFGFFEWYLRCGFVGKAHAVGSRRIVVLCWLNFCLHMFQVAYDLG